MDCVICGEKIPPIRIELKPNAITCCRDCTDENRKRLKRTWSKNNRRSKKATAGASR